MHSHLRTRPIMAAWPSPPATKLTLRDGSDMVCRVLTIGRDRVEEKTVDELRGLWNLTASARLVRTRGALAHAVLHVGV